MKPTPSQIVFLNPLLTNVSTVAMYLCHFLPIMPFKKERPHDFATSLVSGEAAAMGSGFSFRYKKKTKMVSLHRGRCSEM